ncbi:MAG: DNA/RNA non-specific endonuclease [Mogibacterium sp.]|nr:DNA/RNA non-specific endonuclease [Mogibacterium sp.]
MSRKDNSKKNTKDKSRRSPALALLLILILAGVFFAVSDVPFIKSARDSLMQKLGYEAADDGGGAENSGDTGNTADGGLDASSLPEYDGQYYIQVNGNVPVFPDEVYERAGLVKDGDSWKTKGNLFGTIDSNKLTPYEYYGSLDSLGRCTYAYGCLGPETMPEEGEERGDISSVHPSGWAKAQNWERCHLIAWALSAENANPSNLITGTHYLNYESMRPLEEEVEHYIWSTGDHVLYMVKPWFVGDEPVARGVQMTAMSLEDGGKGISFNVYCFNVTPGAEIDYMTGIVTTDEQAAQEPRLYVINTRSKVFHYPTCDGVKEMSPYNKKEVTATRVELTSQGYTPCGYCEP